ncbi:type II toxin-antitoxin system RelE/ParE family toxin [Desulfovirgula thermocuniculi]|uniref:type II toxin-antitoxin system RelE/ParE family toxin n=1 Tax=Desulfovirgula thermocuniculi TaxID=348842 RepID=UPI000480F491|nr:type II toxin-antitoxin system RelE/ParE family toxin [Desulfovirgula thermocuniculi]
MREIIFYETPSGRHPVADYVSSLQVKAQAKVARALDLLQEFGPAIGQPHVKRLEGTGGLYELRVPFGGQAHRLLFFLDGSDIVLVHGFTKKSDKIPRKEIQTAALRMKDYFQRKGRSKG